MAYKRVEVPAAELERQREICDKIREGLGGARPLAFVDTYGCQQNEADSEALRGYIELMGFGFTEDENEAELIVVNTCAVRGHAEMRVLGNVGALVHAKARNPRLIVAVCGCMVQQPHMAEKIKKSFRVVDLCFGPHELWRFPELYERALRRRGRVFETSPCEGVVAEGLPVHRQGSVKAWLSIMYGCNNFCTYCIVPYVRGRERSRRFDDVVAEIDSALKRELERRAAKTHECHGRAGAQPIGPGGALSHQRRRYSYRSADYRAGSDRFPVQYRQNQYARGLCALYSLV